MLSCATLVVWLATVSAPADHRRAQINALIRSGAIGHLDAALQKRFAAQVLWLAKHAGVKGLVSVNGEIRRDRLTVLSTDPKFKSLTGCGSGNALFDPALDAIFLDESLVRPIDLPLLGSKGAYSMSNVDTFGFVVSYINFVLAHELGHRQSGRKAAGFFSYGVNSGSARTLAQEQSADRFAVSTIVKGYVAGDVPEALKKANAVSALGLTGGGLSQSDRGAADILGAMVVMSKALLFSSSPYSPYYFNANHQSFLERARDALSSVDGPLTDQALWAKAPAFREDLARTASLSHWPSIELYFPEPLVLVDARAGALWVGTRAIPVGGEYEISEHLYRLPLDSLAVHSGSLRRQSVIAVAMASSRKAADSPLGDWVEAAFARGDEKVGLPPPEPSDQPISERGFRARTKWGGLAYTGLEWVWPSDGGQEVRVAEADVKREAALKWHYLDMEFGRFQRFKNGVAVPVVTSDSSKKKSFRLVRFSGPAASQWSLDPSYSLDAGEG